MKKLFIAAACTVPLLIAPTTYAQTTAAPAAPAAESTPATPARGSTATTPAPGSATSPAAGVSSSAAMTEAITGWSVKDKIMGKTVYNEANEKIGEVDDVVLAADGKAAYFIIGAGGFLGVGSHDVAVPFDRVTQMENKLTLQGMTKDQLKALPEVKLAK
ncbi:PRC-barrel domain containing protein [Candidimonas sp. SYP-B2681]|uniref:PRC-barrel domain-containing protein n=1 Tax=Candidimonas sp. SYP-B2681 TaxID=2497686 RepID=UPI000F8603AC|nr:PRC-barrel domain-containing protein [Candidimonas sp. SYP-B2681]RTZ44586.1 PRC-barrel domain containing protein [Candidimonas sp. SYP-B2681]